eukprot:66304-Rhodomonas_salina.1
MVSEGSAEVQCGGKGHREVDVCVACAASTPLTRGLSPGSQESATRLESLAADAGPGRDWVHGRVLAQRRATVPWRLRRCVLRQAAKRFGCCQARPGRGLRNGKPGSGPRVQGLLIGLREPEAGPQLTLLPTTQP